MQELNNMNIRRFGAPAVNIMIVILVITGMSGCDHAAHYRLETGKNWPVYLGGEHSNQYSPLSQIDKTNVKHLKVAWEYHTGDKGKRNDTQIQCNPLIIDGVLYGTSPKLKVFALDASTGREIWKFDPRISTNFAMNVNRGVTYWTDGKEARIFFTAGPYLYALDAKTGKKIRDFALMGQASLKSRLGPRAQRLYVVSTSPGIIYKDLLIIGTRVSEDMHAAPGYIRAYDVHSGKVRWTFHTIPKPGEYGYDTWPKDAYKRSGGANSWAGMSLDSERGIVFVPTGSAAFDFYGGNRKGMNLFANCVLALNAETGERIWHYQTVHHDLWDRDLPAPPNLVKVVHNGRETDAVAQITKSGFVFLLNRETGLPLFPVEERPVKSSDLFGEEAWPTQPVPQLPPPYSRQKFTLDEVTNISREAHDYVAGILHNIRYGEPFIPPSREGTLIFPGFDGGGEWGGAASHEGILYVNANVMPWILTMVEIIPGEQGMKMSPGEMTYRMYCSMCHGPDRKGDPSGTYPSLVHVGDTLSKAEINEIIHNGKGFMPSYSYITEKRIKAVIGYLLGTEKPEPVQEMPKRKYDEREVPYTFTGYNRFFDPYGYPAIKPPWGTLTAIDLNRGKWLWQVPLGEIDSLTARGIPKTGTENYGGPVLTAGGVIFIGASKDENFRAFDKDTGEELWKYKLPAGGYATPAVYEVDGREYVVIACGGGKMGTKSGDSYVAFTLEE